MQNKRTGNGRAATTYLLYILTFTYFALLAYLLIILTINIICIC